MEQNRTPLTAGQATAYYGASIPPPTAEHFGTKQSKYSPLHKWRGAGGEVLKGVPAWNKMEPFRLAPMSQSTFPNNREGVKRQQSGSAEGQLSIKATTATVEALGSGAFLSFFLCAHKERTAIKEHTRGTRVEQNGTPLTAGQAYPPPLMEQNRTK